MHEAIDGRCCGHRILEDLVPFAEGKVARQQHAPSFVAFRQKCEQNLHLFATLLDVAKIVDDQTLEARQLLDQFWQTQIPLCNQQLLNQQTACRKLQTATKKNQLFRQRTQGVTLTSTFVMHLLDGDMRALSELETFDVVDQLRRLWEQVTSESFVLLYSDFTRLNLAVKRSHL